MKISLSRYKLILIVFTFLFSFLLLGQTEPNTITQEDIEFSNFVSLVSSNDKQVHKNAISFLTKNWKPEFEIIILEIFYFSQDFELNQLLLKLIKAKTGKRYGLDVNKWYEDLWSKPQRLTPYYHKFKAQLHGLIDRRFTTYFYNRQNTAKIRLDEVRWGGVKQDGIQPLRNPEMILANEADYLDDDNIVFGIEIDGDFRAYPKRILAWHEMFTDTISDVPVAGVYCTLCGTVILYKTEFQGKKYDLGTSGFLYRSNKLMYDKATQSLWNTIWGKPVVGPLVDKGIELDYLSVVTTTWGEWKSRHPETTVLSLRTGHTRNYNEGIAYKDYFSTDDVMFNVPNLDKRLKNKQLILAIKLPEITDETIAISSKFLSKNIIYYNELAEQQFVVLTDVSGANRVYFSKGVEFEYYDQKTTLRDKSGTKWMLYENFIKSDSGKIIKRLHSFNAFWFGWKAAHPNTKLIK
ncbi:DUF3179 domain-containing protein [Winogradskyella haliclonae]|uniref:DUF3179 domain-containing protein n=1 Tax=Winogradskyella haliclonae TaxID=2048558 RepID=A0ABQ2BZV0_9FLAO|nr:DUF3179 domain-containing protein [Winogradskyella haliclonae]GGI57466.1 hypothetical protein GCM10011444_17750 [Winogradskyella haliclonae]